MTRIPDVPCSGCGKLCYRSQITSTPGVQTCRKCRQENSPIGVLANCRGCGEGFTKKNYRTAYCSIGCANQHKGYTEQPPGPCQDCGKTTSRRVTRGVRRCEACRDKSR